jgi:NADPH2:quinone reductase
MRALVTSPDKPYVRMAEVPEPTPDHDEAIVEVRAVSVNRGELVSLPNFWDVRVDGSTMSEPLGSVPGYEMSGVVTQAAADGSGPAVGDRVAGFPARGTWAQYASCHTTLLGRIPDQVTFEQAATLPVAGQTAYRALRRGGFLLGKRVLVTGAAGGVGTFAIQLAKLAGAHVTGITRSAERRAAILKLGADAAWSSLSPTGDREFDQIMEAVGGSSLGASFARVAQRGTIVQYGEASLEPITFPAGLYATMPGVRYEPFLLYPDLQGDFSGTATLELLADFVAAGQLRPIIADVLPWDEAATALDRLRERSYVGKIVLTVS